jgi:hypothetical protein
MTLLRIGCRLDSIDGNGNTVFTFMLKPCEKLATIRKGLEELIQASRLCLALCRGSVCPPLCAESRRRAPFGCAGAVGAPSGRSLFAQRSTATLLDGAADVAAL